METNEEIVALIQAGRSDLFLELWQRVKRYVRKRALFRLNYRGFDGCPGCGGVELDDLMQAGFIAMTGAVKTFSPGESSFISWLTYYLKIAFNEGQGISTSKRDPLDMCISLDRPESDESDDTIIESIPGAEVWEDTDRKIYLDELHAALEKALSEIPEKQAEILRRIVYQNQTLREAGEAIGVTTSRAGVIKKDGIRSLKNNRGLRQFLREELNYYYHVGPKTFNSTHTSSTEYLALWRMVLERRYARMVSRLERNLTNSGEKAAKNISGEEIPTQGGLSPQG